MPTALLGYAKYGIFAVCLLLCWMIYKIVLKFLQYQEGDKDTLVKVVQGNTTAMQNLVNVVNQSIAVSKETCAIQQEVKLMLVKRNGN